MNLKLLSEPFRQRFFSRQTCYVLRRTTAKTSLSYGLDISSFAGNLKMLVNILQLFRNIVGSHAVCIAAKGIN
jgi:hypothetical protein